MNNNKPFGLVLAVFNEDHRYIVFNILQYNWFAILVLIRYNVSDVNIYVTVRFLMKVFSCKFITQCIVKVSVVFR